MKRKNLMNSLIMLFALLMVSNTGFAQVTTEVDMAKAVFETIKNSDLETFSSYCATDEKMTKMLDGMEETTPKEKGIKQELTQESASFINEAVKEYNALIKELNTTDIALDKGKYSDFTSKERFDVPNCKAITIKFVTSFNDETYYQIKFDIFKTETDLFIYNFHSRNLYEQKP